MSILGLFCIMEVVEDSCFSCQRKIIQANSIVNTEAKEDLTRVLSRGSFVFPRRTRGHSLLSWILDSQQSFVVPSVVFVSIEKEFRS